MLYVFKRERKILAVFSFSAKHTEGFVEEHQYINGRKSVYVCSTGVIIYGKRHITSRKLAANLVFCRFRTQQYQRRFILAEVLLFLILLENAL